MVKESIKVVGILPEHLYNKFSSIFDPWDKKKAMILFCDYSEYDILAEHIFNEIIAREKAPNSIVSKILLKKISQEFFRKYDMIPKGHKTICLFEFLDGQIPEIIYKLPVMDGWHQTNEVSLKFQ
jgi:hypothetical protein